MKNLKKFFSVFLCVVLLVISVCSLVSYADESDVYYDIENGVLCVYGDGPMTESFICNSSVTEVYIERGITSVPEGAFNGCSNLEKVTISNSVVSIGDGAFEDCSALKEVKLSKNISEIPEFAFSGCELLENINIPDSVTEIQYGAFMNCYALEYVILPYSLTFIDANAFKNCNSLSTVYYSGGADDWSDVSVSDNKINSLNITFLSPNIYYEKTYSSGKMALSLKLGRGSINALDMQFSPVGNCSIYRIRANKSYTSSNNRNTGIVSMASNESMDVGDEIVKVTFSVTNCENYSVDISFLSCTVRVENCDIDVPVDFECTTVQGGHSPQTWSVISDPTEEADGIAESSCICCGASSQRNLQFAFKNCIVQNRIILFSSFGVDENTFKSDYFLTDSPELIPSGSFVGTGSTVSVDYSDGIVIDYDVSLLGDVDGDGFCDAQDSMLIMCMCENMIDRNTVSECVLLASDCNKDDCIDYSDAENAQHYGLLAV